MTTPINNIEANDHEVRTMAGTLAGDIKKELSTSTSPHECLYLYMVLVDTLALLGETAPPLESIAPLMQTEGVDMAELRAHVVEQHKQDEAENQRWIALQVARLKVEEAIKTYGEESVQARSAIAAALQHLPPEQLDGLARRAREMGLMPKAAGYTDDNQPVFAAADIAAHFGMDEGEVIASMETDPSLSVDAASVRRVQ